MVKDDNIKYFEKCTDSIFNKLNSLENELDEYINKNGDTIEKKLYKFRRSIISAKNLIDESLLLIEEINILK